MKRSMVSVMILAAVLAFLYVPIILVVVYGFVPNGISMSFFGSDGSFLGFTGKWYKYIFTGHQSVRSLLESFWLSLIIAGLSTLASCAIGRPRRSRSTSGRTAFSRYTMRSSTRRLSCPTS